MQISCNALVRTVIVVTQVISQYMQIITGQRCKERNKKLASNFCQFSISVGINSKYLKINETSVYGGMRISSPSNCRDASRIKEGKYVNTVYQRF